MDIADIIIYVLVGIVGLIQFFKKKPKYEKKLQDIKETYVDAEINKLFSDGSFEKEEKIKRVKPIIKNNNEEKITNYYSKYKREKKKIVKAVKTKDKSSSDLEEITEDFDIRKAIIYNEIIEKKYF